MAGIGTITRKDLITDEAIKWGDDYNKEVQKAIDKNKEFLASIKGYSDVLKSIKDVKTNEQFREAKQREIKVLNQASIVWKEQAQLENTLISTMRRRELATESTNRALVKERFELQQVNKNVKQAAILSSALSTEYQKLTVRLNQAGQVVQNLNAKKLQGIKLTQAEQVQLKKSSAEFQRYQRAVLGADASIGRFQRNVGNYPKGLLAAANAVRQLAGAMGLVGGAFLAVRVVSDAFKRIREFDKEMQNMAGILRTTRPDLEELETRIIKVASVSIKTSNEVAKLATSLLTLGKTKDEVLQLLEPVNNLSIALGATSDEAGEFLIQTLNAFGKGTESAAEFADTIAGIRISTSLDFQKMRDSFAYISPISKILNKDLEQTGALIGVLADNGIKAESAGRLLATAQLKLATEGKTLEEALNAINKAYQEGKRDIELAAVASEYFDSQSVKLGITLASQQDRLLEYENRIRSSAGALDDLVEEQLKSVDAQLKITSSTWEEFVLGVENGEGRISSALSGVLGFVNSVLKGFTLLNKSQKEYNEYLRDDVAYETLKEAEATYRSMGDIAAELALKESDRSRDRIDEINDEIKALEAQNKAIKDNENAIGSFAGKLVQKGSFGLISGDAPQISANNKKLQELNSSLGYFNGLLEASENVLEKTNASLNENTGKQNDNDKTKVRSIETLRELIKLERDRIEKLDLEDESQRALIPSIQKTIDGYQKEIDAILGGTKARREMNEALRGSLAYMEKELSILKQKQSNLATTSEGYLDHEKSIRIAERAVKEFKDQVSLLLVELDGVNAGLKATGDTESSIKKLSEIINDKDFGKIEGLDYDRALSDLADFSSKFTSQEQDRYNKLIDLHREFNERQKELENDFADASIDLTNTIFDARIEKIEREIDANNEKFNSWLENENLTEKERDDIEKKRDEKEKELNKKKRQEMIKQEMFNRGIALAEIAINLAKTISAINLAAIAMDALAPYAFGAVGATYRGLQIGLAIGTAALQTGNVLAAPLPAYEHGTDDHKGGYALVAEKRPEVIIEPNKAPYIVSKQSVLDLKKGTQVIPSISEFEKMQKASMLASLDIEANKLNAYNPAISFDDRYSAEIVDELKKMNKKKTNVVVNSPKQDINYDLWKMNNYRWR